MIPDDLKLKNGVKDASEPEFQTYLYPSLIIIQNLSQNFDFH